MLIIESIVRIIDFYFFKIIGTNYMKKILKHTNVELILLFYSTYILRVDLKRNKKFTITY